MSRNPLLTDVYQKLDLMSGRLLDACRLPTTSDEEGAWLNNGDWLELADKIGAEKIFFVKDEPVIVFQQLDTLPSDDELTNIIRKAWCMSRPQRLFLALPTELRVYDLTCLPVNETSQQLKSPLATVNNAVDILEKLQAYRREQLESGNLRPEKRFGQRADKQLIQDLKYVRKALEEAGLKLEYAHALISRAIFIRYLEDRKILTKDYFEGVAGKENHDNRHALLRTELEKSAVIAEDKDYFFYRVLQDKAFTYALFDKLSEDFNGDLFPRDDQEKEHVKQSHLDLLRGFLLGDSGKQQKIFFWLYDFEIVPIELISHIYEEFYHTTKAEDSKGTGSHYTPSALAEFVLSEVLTHKRLQTNPTVLDPACGSGIFLVEAFRRIVRFKMQQAGRPLSALELRAILRDQIRGIELNKNAVDISAFSLYLALLHYQEPRDILAQIKEGAPSDKPLPHLIYNRNKERVEDYYNILFCCNAFDPLSGELTLAWSKESKEWLYGFIKYDALYEMGLPIKFGSIDIVVGNPPWGFVSKNTSDNIRKSQDQVEEWCKICDWTIGDKELSQAFIARSLSFLKEDTGEAALLVSTGVFLKRHKNSQLFRTKWLTQTTIKKVVNFSHVRHAFFSAISPFAFVHYQNKPASFSHRVQHWSAKKTENSTNNQAVVLSASDIRQIKQSDLLANESLWKTYWWGGHRDAALLNILKLEKPLSDFADKNDKGLPIIGRGFESASGKTQPQWLKDYKELPIKYFNRYIAINNLYLVNIPSTIHRFGNRALYEGWRLLVKRGITEKKGTNGRIEARLENNSFCFRHSIHGVKLNNLTDWQRKVITAIFWSSLSRYYFFMTSGSWGMWHHELQLAEIENFPVCLPKDKNLQEKIVGIVDNLRNRDDELLDGRDEIVMLEKQLDKAIFEIYGLSEAEQDLVLDMCETGLEFFYQANNSEAAKTIDSTARQGLMQDLPQNRSQEQGLQGYLYAFLDAWNAELEPEGEFNWTVINLPNNPMLAVIFSTQNKGEPLRSLPDTTQADWDAVLARCGMALKCRVSRNIYIEGMVRSVSDTEIIIIKRNERRLWTRTAAREDAEATLAQAIRLQEQA